MAAAFPSLAGNVVHVPAGADAAAMRQALSAIEDLSDEEIEDQVAAWTDSAFEPYGEVSIGRSRPWDPADVLACSAGSVHGASVAADHAPVAGWIGDALGALRLSDCSDGELLDAVALWERLASWVAGQQARVIAEFCSRRPVVDDQEDRDRYLFPGAEPADPEVDDSAADELSVALCIAPGTAQSRIGFARDLVLRHPAVTGGMLEGMVSVAKAHVITDQSLQLTDEQCRQLDQRVLPDIAGKTRRQVYEKARREVIRIDPDALRRRRQAAAGQRRVQFLPRPDGMSELGVTLPAPDGVAVYTWLDQHARAAKGAGDERTLDQLRADALVDVVLARSSSVARKPLVRVLVPASTLAGGTSPAELAGYGPIDADLARRLAADGSWRRLLTDPVSGAITGISTRRYAPPAALTAYVRARDRTCRFPTCNQPAHRCDIDHTVPWRMSRSTAAHNLGILCRRHHKLKDAPGSRWRLHQSEEGRFTWTTPTGHALTITPQAVTEPAPPAEHEGHEAAVEHDGAAEPELSAGPQRPAEPASPTEAASAARDNVTVGTAAPADDLTSSDASMSASPAVPAEDPVPTEDSVPAEDPVPTYTAGPAESASPGDADPPPF